MLHLVGILFPHINEDARSKSHQRSMDGYCHFHIRTAHMQTFHTMCPKCPPCSVTRHAPSPITDPRTRKRSIYVQFLCFGQQNTNINGCHLFHKHSVYANHNNSGTITLFCASNNHIFRYSEAAGARRFRLQIR